MRKIFFLIPPALILSLFLSSCKKDTEDGKIIHPSAKQTSSQEWGGENPESVVRTIHCEEVEIEVTPYIVMDCHCWYPAYDCLPTFILTAPRPPGWVGFTDAVENGTTYEYFGTIQAANFFEDLSSTQISQLQDSSIGFMLSPESRVTGEFMYIAANKAAITYYDSVYNCNENTMNTIEYAECFFSKIDEMKSNGEIIVTIPAKEE